MPERRTDWTENDRRTEDNERRDREAAERAERRLRYGHDAPAPSRAHAAAHRCARCGYPLGLDDCMGIDRDRYHLMCGTQEMAERAQAQAEKVLGAMADDAEKAMGKSLLRKLEQQRKEGVA